jgi:oxygen-independent coproporphyrinogen-3 oxidase
LPEDFRNGGFGLYVHWPFCEAKCPYCDFNSHVTQRVDHAVWTTAYLSEIQHYARETPGRVLNSIFFGGGTPSLMDPGTVAAVIDAACRAWTPANDLEISLEANPGSVEAARFAEYALAGVNRVSLGVQALNDEDLRRLGRIHSTEEALRAINIAQNAFQRVSFDLIYARQDQTADAWQDELTKAISLGTNHLSLYQLTIEPGTVFGARHYAGKLRGLPDEDRAVDLLDITQDVTTAHGLLRYEVSNHARPGEESRHNLIYWRYGDYVGIGPGAHGRITLNGQRHATEQFRDPNRWLQATESGHGESVRDCLTAHQAAEEFLMMGLRLKEGVDLTRYIRLTGAEVDRDKIATLQDLGFLSLQNERLVVNNQGFNVLNAILEDLLTTR